MKRSLLRLWTCALLLSATVLVTLPGTTAKYVMQTETASFTLSVTPLTDQYILRRGTLFSKIVKDNAPDIQYLYFITQTRTSFTEGVGGPTHPGPEDGARPFRPGNYWNWESGVDIGVTNDTVRFFYDSANKTGYVIGKGDHIIQENSDPTYMFYGLDSLKEVYFVDYNGKMIFQQEQIQPA